jgi:hypothetical protein
MSLLFFFLSLLVAIALTFYFDQPKRQPFYFLFSLAHWKHHVNCCCSCVHFLSKGLDSNFELINESNRILFFTAFGRSWEKMNATTNGGGMGGFQSPVMNGSGGEQQIIQQDLIRTQQVDAVQNAALTLMGQDEGNICDLENILRSRQASDNYAKALNQFQRLRASSLPARLFDEFNNVRAKCFMGIFPEINRVWVTIDNRLFLWDFIEG